MPYSYATFAQSRAALALRLGDPTNQFWTDAECGVYIKEALRTRNALTNEWTAELVFSSSGAKTWFDTSAVANSPRVRTITDSDIYTQMEYHLLESPVGAALGSGSGQFTIQDLSQALQRRRDELILAGKLSMAVLTQNSSLNRRESVPDNVLEIERVRWIPVTNPAGYSTAVLSREDSLATEYFAPGAENTTSPPTSFDTISGPPLIMQVDYLPPIASQYEMLIVQAGTTFAPPFSTLMGIPDDLAWIAKWGALSDLFAKGDEATDIARAQYCLARYQDGLKLVMKQPWLLMGRLNNTRVDTPSVTEMDQYAYGWEANTGADAAIVVGGMDLVAPCPVPSSATGVSLTVVSNAPVPVADGDFIQCPRDSYDAVLDYAQSLAFIKQGAAEVEQGKSLVRNFYLSAAETNKRLAGLGIYRDVMLSEGNRAEAVYAR